MSFVSLQYIVFLPIVISLYFILPPRFKIPFIVTASFYFYMTWRVEYGLLLFVVCLAGWYMGNKISESGNQSAKKRILSLYLLFIFAILFVFKYFNFFSENVLLMLNAAGIKAVIPVLNLAMPAGISFFVMQSAGYAFDIYNSKILPEKSIVKYGAFVSFFPKIISGPIERGGFLLPQFGRTNKINYKNTADGFKLIVWGLFKKVVIADRLIFAVSRAFSSPESYSGAELAFATLLLSFQIYADFSGYTDIALGSAKLMGFNLTDNFKRPYFSVSLSDFWRRWHITLSFWLRDYLFLPLAYSVTRRIIKLKLKNIKTENWAYITGISITMAVCGLWHGAKWTFIIWGLIHGVYLAVGFLTKKLRNRIYRYIKLNKELRNYFALLLTFIFVTFSWIFFNSDSIQNSFVIIGRIFSFSGVSISPGLFLLNADYVVSVLSVILMLTFEFILFRKEKTGINTGIPELIKVPLLLILLMVIIVFGKFENADFFIFQVLMS